VWVEDQGAGIPADERIRIWEPFHRLERDANSAIAGSGIGLALVRNLAVAHGGRVYVEDGATGGSRFTVEIPCFGRAYGPVTERLAPATEAAYRPAHERQLVTRP